jgi:hypothetical protein
MNWMAIVIASWVLPTTVEGPTAALRLESARLEMVERAGQSGVRFAAVVVNELDETVNSLDIGIAIGLEEPRISLQDLPSIYAGRQIDGVDYQRVAIVTEVVGHSRVAVSQPVNLSHVGRHQFFSHLLGYGLLDPTQATLLRLLESRVAADEMAVVGSLGLSFHEGQWQVEPEMSSVRAKAAQWLDVMDADWPLKPTLRDLKQLCVGALAASLDGSEKSRAKIRHMAERSGIEWFDEPLQLLRTARLVSTPLESPLAFLIPDEPVTMAAALTALADGGIELVEALPPEPGVEQLAAEDLGPGRVPASGGWGWWIAVALGLMTLFCYRRMRGPESGEGD